MIDVKRSPTRITWHVLYCNQRGDTMLCTADTWKQAAQTARKLASAYGLPLSGKLSAFFGVSK